MPTRRPLSWFSEKITAGEHYSLARFGDGEWGGILGLLESNGSGSQNFEPHLQQALADVVVVNRVTYTLARFGIYREPAQAWLANRNIRRRWYHADLFAQSYVDGDLSSFLGAIRQRSVVLVGNTMHAQLALFDRTFIEVPQQNCWSQYVDIYDRVTSALQADSIVICCCGPTAKVLVHDLALRKDIWSIDCGSVFDAFVGPGTRMYHRKRRAKDVKV